MTDFVSCDHLLSSFLVTYNVNLSNY